jgi:curved DNA-binding protein CbpA
MANKVSDDFYALLGIDAGVDCEQLREAWRKLARRWHPDYAGPEATAMFQQISAAYEVLADPVARAAYDERRGADRLRAVNYAGVATAAPVGARRRAPSVMIARACGPLNSLLACGVARRAEGGLIDLFLTVSEAAQGGMIAISMRVAVRKAQALVEELFSAWLAISPGVAEGAIIAPSASLPGMIQPVRFRIRIQAGKTAAHPAPP